MAESEQKVTQQTQTFKYPEWAKMPEGYDFSTKGMDWSKFENEYLLRTDAVWEKFKLKEFFRLYYKAFYFDPRTSEYVVTEPEDMYTLLHEGFALDDYFTTYYGMTPTGRTNAFQIAQGPKERTQVSAQTNFYHTDFLELCALRFEKWSDCDVKFSELRSKIFDRTRKNILDPSKRYPCFREYYEASYACNDDMFDFLLELNYIRRANDFEPRYVSNLELKRRPTIYDNPSENDRRTYTY